MIRANTSAAALSSSRPLPVALRTIARHAPTRVRCAPVMKIDYVKASEVPKLVEQGYTMVDIRDQIQVDRARLIDAVHVPLFVPDEGKDLQSLLNQQLHAGSVGGQRGSKHTVRNEQFESQVAAKWGKDDKLIIMCQQGLRSNAAAQELAASGFQNLVCIEGGLDNLKDDVLGGLKVEGKEMISKAGSGGLLKYQTTISFTVGGIAMALYVFLEFFPEQAQPILNQIYGLPAP